jgi:hypothetical protein
VMPTHVHVLVSPRWPLPKVVHGWKSFAANAANHVLCRRGPFWAPDYFDRLVRDDTQMDAALAYIEDNPVAAGLCHDRADWPWSSARKPSWSAALQAASGPGRPGSEP